MATALTPSVGPSRAPAGAAREDLRLLVATVRLRIPDRTWPGPFSRRHPLVDIEILTATEVDDRTLVGDVWISGGPPGAWAREIRTLPDVDRVESLAEIGHGTLYRVRCRPPPIFALYRRLEVPVPFPLRIRGGSVRWEVVARAAEFAQILEFGRGVDPTLRVAWTRRPPLRTHLPVLTRSQQSLLDRAIVAGYFAVPRRISLTELAHAVNRSKAAVSQALALIEQRLLESALRPGPVGIAPPAPAR
jgi:hypothetical protein